MKSIVPFGLSYEWISSAWFTLKYHEFITQFNQVWTVHFQWLFQLSGNENQIRLMMDHPNLKELYFHPEFPEWLWIENTGETINLDCVFIFTDFKRFHSEFSSECMSFYLQDIFVHLLSETSSLFSNCLKHRKKRGEDKLYNLNHHLLS